MHSIPLITCPPPGLAERALRLAAALLLRAADGWRGWQLRRASRHQAWLEATLSEELSTALLHDIGAPAWLLAQSAARRKAEGWRTEALRSGVPLL